MCQLNQFIDLTRLGQQIAACTLCQDKQLIPEARPIFQLPETARIAVEFGLPYDMVYRHPFPGPGLGVRILGEVKKEYADILRRAATNT